MLKSFIVVLLLVCQSFVFAQKKPAPDTDEWTTLAEKTNFVETPKYKETIDFCRRLAKSSKWISFNSFGRSGEGRDLPFVILSKEKKLTPELQKKSKNALVMVQCGIHAGEIDGKDAMLMLMRDIGISKKYENLLNHVNLLIIPIFNVDGHERISEYNRINQNGPKEMGWRVTARNLNLNRDYLKADAIEMKYWLQLFNEWLPDFFIDCHVTDGSDFPYDVTYEVEMHENIYKGLANWTKNKLIPYLIPNVEKTNHLIAPYNNFKDEFDVSKGMIGGVMSPRLSTGYTAIQNRQGFLIETHSYKDYKTRVSATYEVVRILTEFINNNFQELKNLNKEADRETEKMYDLNRSFPLSFEVTTQSEPFHFKSYKVNKEMSKISGTYTRSYIHELIEQEIPYFNFFRVKDSIIPPFAYLIPQEWSDLVNIMLLHGIQVGQLLDDRTLPIERYNLRNSKWRAKPYEGRHSLKYDIEKMNDNVLFPKGTFIVPLNQRASKVIMYLLEPRSDESFVFWGFMDAIFEQKEYAEDYVLEKFAADTLSKDYNLKEEFENKLKSDTAFANNPEERLNFFYKKSPYWDTHIGQYPISRLMQRQNFLK